MKEYIVADTGDIMMIGGKIERELVRCKDCARGGIVYADGMLPYINCYDEDHDLDWFCADGVRRQATVK